MQQGSEGNTTRIRRLYNKEQEVIRRNFLVSVLISASVERCFFSRMQDFFLLLFFFEKYIFKIKFELVGGGSVINRAYPV